jgi:hypothetical protein
VTPTIGRSSLEGKRDRRTIAAPDDFRSWPCVTSIAGPYGDTQLYER